MMQINRDLSITLCIIILVMSVYMAWYDLSKQITAIENAVKKEIIRVHRLDQVEQATKEMVKQWGWK